uniref:Uncharacterized protein n=1 Tax=Plectus sambesii TaxID=2011161 RepID=A0A914XD94_9BILA
MSSNGSSVSKESRTLGFQEDVDRYKCLCGRLAVRKATLVIAISTLIYSIAFIVLSATRLHHGHAILHVKFDNSTKNVTIGPALGAFFASAMGFNIVQFVTVITTLIALKKENQFFLVPKMMMQILTEIFYIAAAFVFAAVVFVKQYDFEYKVIGTVAWFEDKEYNVTEAKVRAMVTWAAVGLTFLAIACAILQVWTFTIVLGCYRMFRDKYDWGHWIEHSKDIRAGSFDPLVQLGTLQR